MAAKEVSNQRHRGGDRTPSVAAGGGQSRSNPMGQAAGGAAARVGEQASDYLERGTAQVRALTRDREGTAVLVALATGFGIGFALGSMIAMSSSRPKTWRERMGADRYRQQLEGYRHQLEGYGRQLVDRIEKVVPEAVAQRLAALKP